MTAELDKDDNSPATNTDLALLAGEMALRFDGVYSELRAIRSDMQELRTDISSLQRGQEAILKIVSSIDMQLRELKTLPARVEHLERSRH